MSKAQPRDDYRELLELSIIALGATPYEGKDVHIRRPGALDRARWMARAIYSLKIYLFRGQFHITKREATQLDAFVAFTLNIYVLHWFQAPNAANAPANDLQFLKALSGHKNKNISAVAVKAFSHHSWYLAEALAGLALFDSRISDAQKSEMVKSMGFLGPTAASSHVSVTENVPKRVTIPLSIIGTQEFQNRELSTFMTTNSRRILTILPSGFDFITCPPCEWNGREDYQAAMKYVNSLHVTNDFAERGVALITDFNSALTKDEEQKQYLLQVVEHHRKQFPNPKKTTVS